MRNSQSLRTWYNFSFHPDHIHLILFTFDVITSLLELSPSFARQKLSRWTIYVRNIQFFSSHYGRNHILLCHFNVISVHGCMHVRSVPSEDIWAPLHCRGSERAFISHESFLCSIQTSSVFSCLAETEHCCHSDDYLLNNDGSPWILYWMALVCSRDGAWTREELPQMLFCVTIG